MSDAPSPHLSAAQMRALRGMERVVMEIEHQCRVARHSGYQIVAAVLNPSSYRVLLGGYQIAAEIEGRPRPHIIHWVEIFGQQVTIETVMTTCEIQVRYCQPIPPEEQRRYDASPLN